MRNLESNCYTDKLLTISPASPIIHLSSSLPNLVDYFIKSFKSSAKKNTSPDGQASQVLSRKFTSPYELNQY